MGVAILALMTLQTASWEAAPAPGAVTGVELRPVLVAPDESVWLRVRDRGRARIVANGGAGRLHGGRWEIFTPDDGLPHAVVHAAVADAGGKIRFACRTGLARLESGAMEVLFPETNFRSIPQATTGELWFGTSDGVMGLGEGGGWSRELEGVVAYPRLTSSDGAIWAGSVGAGVLRRDGEGWRSVPMPEAFAEAEILDLDEAADGTIWVASSRGAFRLAPVECGATPPR